MIERFRQLFSREEMQPSDEERPERARKKHRVTQHLENIYQAQRRLEVLERPPLPFSEERLTAGGLAALRILSGAALAPTGFFLRKIEPHFGSIVAYQGVQLFMKGAMHALNRIVPETRGRVDERVGKKKGRKGAATKELLSEGALEAKIREISELTKKRQKKFFEYRKADRVGRNEAKTIPQKGQEGYDEAREKYYQGYIRYLDQLIDGQQDVLEGESESGGLAELVRSLESYHRGIVETHHERADVVGAAGASAILLGGQHTLHGSPLTSETIAALASGIIPLISTSFQRKGKGEARVSYIETINREIDALKKHRLATTLKLALLEEKRLQHEEREEKDGQAKESTTVNRQLSPEEQKEIDDIMAAYKKAVQEIVAPTSSDQQMIGVPSYASTAVMSPSERGVLTDFLGVVIPEKTAPSVEPTERPQGHYRPRALVREDRIKRLDRKTLVERTPVGSIDRKLVNDFYEIAGREAPLHEESFTGDPTIVTAAIDALAKDSSVTEEQLDEILDYLDDLDRTLKANQSILDFRKGHLRTILEHREAVEEALQRRELGTVSRVLKGFSPNALRQYVLVHYGIAGSDENAGLSQQDYEYIIREWMRRDDTKEGDRAPIRRFLVLCLRELQQLPTIDWRQDKEFIVERTLRILNERVSNVPFSSDERMVRSRAERCADLEPIVAAYFEERDASKIPGIGMIARLTFEAKFIPPDDIYEIGYDRKREQKDSGLRNISTPAVIGSYVGFEAEGTRKGWVKTRQEDPEGNEEQEVLQLARPLMASDATVEMFDDFFFDQKTGKERIEVMKIPGIGTHGDLFFVMRGIKHVAAAKVAGLPRITARVHEVRQGTSSHPLEIVTSNLDRYTRMRQMRDKGLIDGEFSDQFTIDEDPSRYSAKIHRQLLPGSIWFSIRRLPEIWSVYQSLYPEAFESLTTLKGDPIIVNSLLNYQPFVSWLMRKGRSSTA